MLGMVRFSEIEFGEKAKWDSGRKGLFAEDSFALLQGKQWHTETRYG